MKFTLTITDMTAEEMTTVANQLGIVEVAPNKPHIVEAVDSDDDDDDSQHATGDFDINGLPWDERIHSSSKKQNKDGSWKARKGVDNVTKDFIEAELRNAVKIASLPAEATPVAPTVDPLTMFQQPAPVIEQPVIAQIPQLQQPIASGVTIQTLMSKFQELLTAKKIEPNFAMELIQYLNQTFGTQYNSIANIATNQQMLNAAMQYTLQKVG